jgi:hypothetical protein
MFLACNLHRHPPNILLMELQTIFQLCNTIALIGWIILLLLPFWIQSDKFILGIIIVLLCIVYAWLIFSFLPLSDLRKFGALPGVMELFSQPELVVAGWVHYLAFDLLAGIFIKRNALKHGISHWIIVPVLLVTFMLGPIGLLLYMMIRAILAKQYFAENF